MASEPFSQPESAGRRAAAERGRAFSGRRLQGALEALLALALASSVFFYPAWQTAKVTFSDEVRKHARAPGLAESFRQTSVRYVSFAKHYLASQRAAQVESHDVAATEWPIFGSVFLMLAAQELVADGSLKLEGDVAEAVDLAARVIAHPATGTWVREKWGESYLERENVFYRMLVILGLEAHAQLTRESSMLDRIRVQASSLGQELLERPYALADDYPGECYPNDVLWAAAAIQRAAAAGHWDRELAQRLSEKLLRTLRGPANTATGLPAFHVVASTAEPTQVARGSANSGLLCMAAELDHGVAVAWFDAYVDHYWEGEGWLWGFRETPRGTPELVDVDSGPVIAGVGTVATGFGIGAARSVGRNDIAAPLVMQTVATSWPTPFGLLLPGTLGWVAADGWCFGELALHFSMTRPTRAGKAVPYVGSVPPSVWIVLSLYLIGGAACLAWALHAFRRARGR